MMVFIYDLLVRRLHIMIYFLLFYPSTFLPLSFSHSLHLPLSTSISTPIPTSTPMFLKEMLRYANTDGQLTSDDLSECIRTLFERHGIPHREEEIVILVR